MLLGQLMHWQQLPGLSAEGRAILERVAPPLLQGLQQRGRKPLRSWVEGIWLALGGPCALLSSDDLQHVRRYFDLLEQHSGEGELDDWQTFTRAVDNLYAAPPADSNAKLQLMTIHKSKGLEFDTVIIPGLDKATAGNDSEMLLWRERIDRNGKPQLLLGPLQASGDSDDQLFEHLKHENKLKTRLENARVIYVGATRAIKQLHLLFHLKSNPKDGYKAPAVNSLLAPLWPALKDQLDESVQLHKAEPTPDDQPTPSLTHFSRLPTNWQPPGHDNNSLLAAYRGRAEGYETDNQMQREDNTARHTGTVLHRTLQQLATDGIDHWHNSTPEASWRAQLQQLGVATDQLPEAVAQLHRGLNNILEDSKGRWILDNKHRDSRCELAVDYISAKGRRTAVIDRTFIADGERWIVDYKSSQPSSEKSLDDFVQQQVEQYRGQLCGYGKLFAQLEELPVRLALYFPMVPHWVEMPFDG